MTPFDKPIDPGEPVQAPNDPGDAPRLIVDLPDDQLPLSVRYRDQVIERQQRHLRELEEQLSHYRARELAILDLIQRNLRQEAYERLHVRVNQVPKDLGLQNAYPQGLGGAGQCDCTMGRDGFLGAIRVVVRKAAGDRDT